MDSPKDIIEKLHLCEGDIIVVRDSDVAMQLAGMTWPPETSHCPIVVAPDGIYTMTADQLRGQLAQIEEWDRSLRPKLRGAMALQSSGTTCLLAHLDEYGNPLPPCHLCRNCDGWV